MKKVMHYDSFVEFKAGLLEAASAAPPDSPSPAKMSSAQIDILFQHYRHARGQRNLTLGRLADTQKLRAMQGTAFDGGTGQLLLTPEASSSFSASAAPPAMHAGKPVVPRGVSAGEWTDWSSGAPRTMTSADWKNKTAKQQMDTLMGNKWSTWLNDCFILGGVHSHALFYLVSSNVSDYGDSSSEFPFNVTQRELIGLVTFGYSRGEPGAKGIEFKCTETQLADAATFKAYVETMNVWQTAVKE